MFDELYEPIPDVEAYLERIGYTGPVEPTLAVLDELVYAHLTHVPFENLGPCVDGILPELGIPALFEAVVVKRQGGYCFELNALFTALLRAIGFECMAVATRGGQNYPHPGMPLHRGTIVTVEGARHWVDVGYGKGCPLYSVPVDSGEVRCTPSGDYRIERVADGWLVLYCGTGDTEKAVFEFEDHPVPEPDYLLMNLYTGSLPDSIFRTMLMLNLYTTTGRKSIAGNVLRITEGETLIERTFDQETELAGILEEHFGIVL